MVAIEHHLSWQVTLSSPDTDLSVLKMWEQGLENVSLLHGPRGTDAHGRGT